METHPQPRISVVICHHQGRDLLQRCLKSLLASQGIQVEIILITSDPTYVAPLEIRQYFLEDGPAAKRNLGIARSTTEFVVFLDDDVEIHSSCLLEFSQWMDDHPRCGMAFGKIYKMAEGRRQEVDDCGSWLTPTGFLFARAGHRSLASAELNRPLQCLASKSATCIARCQSLLDAGGFDRDYYILGEETDVAWRMWLKGWEIWYVPTAVSWHAFGCPELKPKADFYTDERVFRNGCRNYLWLLTTNLGWLSLIRILPWHLLGWMMSVMGFLIRGDWRYAKAILAGFLAYIHTLPQTLQKRRQVQSTRRVSDRELMKRIAVNPPLTYYANRLWRYWTTQLHG